MSDVRSRTREQKIELIRSCYIRDGRICHYCGREMLSIGDVERLAPTNHTKLPVGYPTLDHVTPRSKGGRFVLENLVVACSVCNNKKGDREAFTTTRIRKREISALLCDLCHGKGTGWNDDRDKPCPDCRGAGSLDADRLAELNSEKGRQAAALRHKLEAKDTEIARLKQIIEDTDEGNERWWDRDRLVRRCVSQAKTIIHMEARIRELGGGRAPHHGPPKPR